MELTSTKQLGDILNKSEKPLILLPQNPNGDSVSAGIAFYLFLQKKGSKATIAFYDPLESYKKFSFLPQPEEIIQDISGARDFILSFNTSHNKIIDVRTEKKKNAINIYITPEHGAIDPRDFSFVPAKFKYDSMIVIGSPDKESLGKTFEENPDIFYEVPIINIDNHDTNDNFGQINLVDITASSASEIIFDILEEIDSSIIDEDIANCLLSGIISATGSFQKKNTTPKALQLSANLIGKGADQQKIIRYLYKTQPLNILKLWGKIMSKLKWDTEISLVWALVSIEDFVQSRSKADNIPFILEKIKENYSGSKAFLALYNETPDLIKGVVKFSQPGLAKKILSSEAGKVLEEDTFEFPLDNKNIAEAEKEALEKIKKFLR